MELQRATSVFNPDGIEVGQIERVVIDTNSNAVTHLVVRKGGLLHTDKVVPIDATTSDAGGRIAVKLDAEQLAKLADFEETQYVVTNEDALTHANVQTAPGPPMVPYAYSAQPVPAPQVEPEPAVVKDTTQNIPEGTVAVKPEAKVITFDGKTIGHIEQVRTSPQPEHVTHVLVSKGLLWKKKKLVPVRWIDFWEADQVRLDVGLQSFDELPNEEAASSPPY